MFNESQYPTMRFLRCKRCSKVYVASLSGVNECPECTSSQHADFQEENDSQPASDKAPDKDSDLLTNV